MFSKTRVPARLKVRPAGWHGQNKLACLLLLVSSLAHSASRSPVSHLASPFDLRCSGKSEPLAVLEARPVFSWQLAANSPVQFGVFQSAYRRYKFWLSRAPGYLGTRDEKSGLTVSGSGGF